MTRISAVVLTLLLVTSMPAAAFAGTANPDRAQDAPTASTGELASAQFAVSETNVQSDSIAWIHLQEESATGQTDVTPDLASTLRTGDRQLQQRSSEHVLERRYSAAETSDERQQLLVDALNDVDERIDALTEREAAVALAYTEGEIDRSQLVRELAEVTERAAHLKSTVDTVSSLANQDPNVSVTTRTRDGQLGRFDTPLRADLVEVTRAEQPSLEDVRVATTDRGLTIERLDGERYYRETIRHDRHARGEPNEYEDLIPAQDRVAELYPWVSENRIEASDGWYGPISRIEAPHPQGKSTVYVDSTTEAAFHDHHEVDIGDLSTTATRARSEEGLTLSAHRVPRGGPVWVSVADADTGDPVDAEIEVRGETVATTGDDGETWITAPYGNVPVTATDDDRSATLTVREPSE